MSEFRKELEQVINRHSQENPSNTPDFILAEFVVRSLAAFDAAVNRREQWYGRAPRDDGDKILATPRSHIIAARAPEPVGEHGSAAARRPAPTKEEG